MKKIKLPFFAMQWNSLVGDPKCPFVRRWVFDFKLFSIRLHRWYAGHEDRNLHDHPWWFFVWVLKGNYVDISERNGKIVREHMWTGKMAIRPPHYKHTLETNGAWSLIITGPRKYPWGFWVDGKRMRAKEFFEKFGNKICD